MREKRLSEKMNNSCNAVDDAKETLEQALTDAIEIHFNAGMEVERERIIKLLEDAQVTEAELFDGRIIKVKCESVRTDLLIALIKGENK